MSGYGTLGTAVRRVLDTVGRGFLTFERHPEGGVIPAAPFPQSEGARALLWSEHCTGECGSLCWREGCSHHGPDGEPLTAFIDEAGEWTGSPA